MSIIDEVTSYAERFFRGDGHPIMLEARRFVGAIAAVSHLRQKQGDDNVVVCVLHNDIKVSVPAKELLRRAEDEVTAAYFALHDLAAKAQGDYGFEPLTPPVREE